jgi:[ribosomal protein S5]-alanine N-acetyltransferase
MEIRLIKTSDANMLSAYHEKNTSHFRKWEPRYEPEYYSVSQLKLRLSTFLIAQNKGRAAYFVAIEKSEIIAQCSLTNIIYGPLKAGHIGYSVDSRFEGTGLMTQVCKETIDHAFKTLKLNRLMAAYMPKKYLQINGKWEDHVLTSLVNPENT